MKNFIRILSLVLAVMMIATVLVACGGNEDVTPADDTKDTVAATTEGRDTGLPKIDWAGEQFRILGRDYETDMFKNFEVDREEMPSDVVGVAVWNRNEAIKAKYGLDIVGTLEAKPSNVAKTFLEAGDDMYDMIIQSPKNMPTFAMQGYLLNIGMLEHIDFENDCWNDYANQQLSMGGKLYYTTNKFLLHDKHRTWMVFYNREMARELNIGYLETEVFDGTWTMDRLIEIAKIGAAETDGQDGMSYNDRWGVAFSSDYCFAQLAFASGFRLSENGSDGYPTFVGATDEMISILDKIFELAADDNTCFIWNYRPDADKPAGRLDSDIFFEGHTVVLVDVISTFDDMSRGGFEFGTLPNPKYNEQQENYYSFPNTANGSLFAVPATATDIKKAGFGVEAISEESVGTSYEAYIETKCKLQEVYDQDGAKCLDIIFEGVVYDIAHICDIGGLGTVIENDLLLQGSNIYARLYSKYERKANNELKTIREAYAAH